MAFATADTVSLEAMHTGADDVMSRIFLVMVTSWDSFVRYPLPCCANGAAQSATQLGEAVSRLAQAVPGAGEVRSQIVGAGSLARTPPFVACLCPDDLRTTGQDPP
jgi:hypothetical protein